MPRARHTAALALAALQIGLLWAGAALADGIIARPLPPLEGDISSVAHGINARGLVVGYSFDGLTIAVLWDRQGRPQELPPLEGDAESEAYAINWQGEVAGESRGAATTAVVWNRADTPIALMPLEGDLESFARAINDRGQVAGFSIGRGPIGGVEDGVIVTAVVWGRSGMPRALPPLDGQAESIAIAINAFGEAAGFSYDTGVDDTAVVWNRSGKPIALLPLGGDRGSEAHAINARGKIAGDSGVDAETAVLWQRKLRKHARERDPARSLAPLEGDSDSLAFAINGLGQVAGVSFGADRETAVLWARNGRPKALPPLADDISSAARAINVAGPVAGFSAGDDRHTAVLWQTRGRSRHDRFAER